MKISLAPNVLVSAVITRGLCRDLLRTVLEEHDAVVSQLVLDEFKHVFRDKLGATQPSLEKALMLLDDVEVTTNPTVALDTGTLEANDATILAAAIEARADLFVTGDQALLAAAANIAIPVVSPRRFMELLWVPGNSYPSLPEGDGEPRVSERTPQAVRGKAFEFALSVVKLCRTMREHQETELSSRLLSAGTGIGAAIEEAGAATSRRDFDHKIAGASQKARETNYWLRLLDQSETMPEIDLEPYLEKSNDLARLLTANNEPETTTHP